jgi:hypothetical protein
VVAGRLPKATGRKVWMGAAGRSGIRDHRYGRRLVQPDRGCPGVIKVLLNVLSYALVAGLIAGVIGGFLAREVGPHQVVPSEGVRRSARRALLIGLLAGLVIIPFNLSSLSPIAGPAGFLLGIVSLPFLVVYIFVPILLPLMLWAGGRAWLQHLAVRVLLVRNQAAPWGYVGFLDQASDRLFLRKVGGGYVFVHRLLLEYFAELRRDAVKPLTPQASDVSPAR